VFPYSVGDIQEEPLGYGGGSEAGSGVASHHRMSLVLIRDWLLIAVIAAMPLAAMPLAIGPILLPLTELLLPLAVISAVLVRVRCSTAVTRTGLSRGESWAVGLFLVAALLSLVVTEYPRQSLRELRLLILEPVTLYILLRISALDVAWVKRAVLAFVGVVLALTIVSFGLALAGRGLVDAEGVQRLLGIFPSANHFALVLGRAIPFSLTLALAGKPRWRMYAAITAVLSIALVATFSGGGWLGTAAAVLVVVWLMRGRRVALALLALGGALSVLTLGVLRVERIVSRIDPTRGTGFIRVKLWEASLTMVRDHPILGIGLDNFLYLYRQQYLSPAAADEPNLSHPHNWALHFWLGLGVLGLVSAIWLLLQFFVGIRAVLARSDDPSIRAVAIGATGSVVNFLVHGSVDNSYFLPDMALIFWFTLAIPRILTASEPSA
jgi:putative inorganic carbon (hco3(-)) transporter